MTSYKTQVRLESRIIALAERLEHERRLVEYARDAQEYERLLKKYYRTAQEPQLPEAVLNAIDPTRDLSRARRFYHD